MAVPVESEAQNAERAKSFFGYGNDAAQKGNDSYAAEMYMKACKLAPDNLVYRQSLRGVQRRKFNNDPTKIGRMVGLTLQPLRLKIGAAKSRSKWADLIEHCEEVFVQSPWDTTAAVDAAEAAQQLGLKKVAQYFVESVYAQGEKDARFLRSMAHIEEFADDYQKAIRCWEKLRVILPNDDEGRKKLNDLTAKATIAKSGMAESLNRHAVGVSGPEKDLPPDAEELRANMVSPEQRYLQEIEETPERIGPYLALAENYKHSGRLDDAEKILAKGVKANPDDNYLKGAYAEIQISRLHRAIDAFTRKIAKDPHDVELPIKLAHLKTKLYQYEVAELRRKVAAAPEELKLRMILGKKLAEGGKHDEAIGEFQQARSSPELKVQALLYTGLSFFSNGVLKLAERTFQEAARLAEPTDSTTLNELNYNLGLINMQQGNKSIAEDYFNEVAANDYTYRDVADLLRKLGEKPPPEDD